uniref:DUF5641 domain-containing protein n=1 Tax=Macrostomum lignano TaxID=282301 RepID=A0A1I8F164_9PLAT
HLRRALNVFWDAWKASYVTALREKAFHSQKGGTVAKVGDVVLIHGEPHQPRMQWKMGVVESVVVGRDGAVRSAVVRVSRVSKERGSRGAERAQEHSQQQQQQQQQNTRPRKQSQLEQGASDGAPQSLGANKIRSVVSVGRPSVAQQAVHVSTGSGLTPPERALQGEQQDVLNGLGAVALGPDHAARQLESPSAQDGGRALQLGPIVQGHGPDALSSRQRPRLGVVEQDGFDHRLPQPSPLAVGQRFGLEDGSDRTKGRPGKSSAPPEVFLHVGHQTAEVGEPLAACEPGRLPVCAAACQALFAVAATDASAQQEAVISRGSAVRSTQSSSSTKRNGAKVSPCRTPDEVSNRSDRPSAVTTAARVSQYSAMTASISCWGTRVDWRMRASSMTRRSARICVTVPRCGRNPFCSYRRYGSSTDCRRSSSSRLKSFAVQDISEIPRWSSFRVVPAFFGIGTMCATVHSVGAGAPASTRFMTPVTWEATQRSRSASTRTSSGPSALPPDVFGANSTTSSVVTGLVQKSSSAGSGVSTFPPLATASTTQEAVDLDTVSVISIVVCLAVNTAASLVTALVTWTVACCRPSEHSEKSWRPSAERPAGPAAHHLFGDLGGRLGDGRATRLLSGGHGCLLHSVAGARRDSGGAQVENAEGAVHPGLQIVFLGEVFYHGCRVEVGGHQGARHGTGDQACSDAHSHASKQRASVKPRIDLGNLSDLLGELAVKLNAGIRQKCSCFQMLGGISEQRQAARVLTDLSETKSTGRPVFISFIGGVGRRSPQRQAGVGAVDGGAGSRSGEPQQLQEGELHQLEGHGEGDAQREAADAAQPAEQGAQGDDRLLAVLQRHVGRPGNRHQSQVVGWQADLGLFFQFDVVERTLACPLAPQLRHLGGAGAPAAVGLLNQVAPVHAAPAAWLAQLPASLILAVRAGALLAVHSVQADVSGTGGPGEEADLQDLAGCSRAAAAGPAGGGVEVEGGGAVAVVRDKAADALGDAGIVGVVEDGLAGLADAGRGGQLGGLDAVGLGTAVLDEALGPVADGAGGARLHIVLLVVDVGEGAGLVQHDGQPHGLVVGLLRAEIRRRAGVEAAGRHHHGDAADVGRVLADLQLVAVEVERVQDAADAEAALLLVRHGRVGVAAVAHHAEQQQVAEPVAELADLGRPQVLEVRGHPVVLEQIGCVRGAPAGSEAVDGVAQPAGEVDRAGDAAAGPELRGAGREGLVGADSDAGEQRRVVGQLVRLQADVVLEVLADQIELTPSRQSMLSTKPAHSSLRKGCWSGRTSRPKPRRLVPLANWRRQLVAMAAQQSREVDEIGSLRTGTLELAEPALGPSTAGTGRTSGFIFLLTLTYEYQAANLSAHRVAVNR